MVLKGFPDGNNCCGIAYDNSVSLVQVNGEGFVHCIVGVPGMSDYTLCRS